MLILSCLFSDQDRLILSGVSPSFSSVYKLNRARIDKAITRNCNENRTTETLEWLQERGLPLRFIFWPPVVYLEVCGLQESRISLPRLKAAVTELLNQQSLGIKSPVLSRDHCGALSGLVGLTGWAFEGEDIQAINEVAIKKRFLYWNDYNPTEQLGIYPSIDKGVMCLGEWTDTATFSMMHSAWCEAYHRQNGFW